MEPIFNKTKRLTKDTSYVRPKKTLQDSLSNDDIKEKLKDYKKISDIRKVVIGTHIRYFTKDKEGKKPVFRLGGFLTKFGDEYKYIILSNGSVSWSVQNNGSNEFWAKMNSKEITEIQETEVEQKTKHVEDKYKKLKEQTEYVIKLLEDQKKENDKLNKKLKEIESVTKTNKNKK